VTTIVEFSKAYSRQTQRVMDGKAAFLEKVRNSQLVAYSLEYFSSCFLDDKRLLKAVNMRLYNFKAEHRPETIQYVISWEDVPHDEGLSWQQFQVKVNRYLRDFLEELQTHSNVFEGPL